MNDLEKVAARKCSQCHKFKTREQLTTAADDGGTAVHLCDDCKTQNAEKAIKAAGVLDTFRVTAYTADGQVDDTTVAKALGMDAQARVAKNRRDDWRRAVETIDAALAKAPYMAGGELAKSQALDRLAKSDPIAQFGRMVQAFLREGREIQAQKRLAGLVKAELTRRNTASKTAERMAKSEKLRRKTAKLQKQSAESRARVAESERLLAEAVQQQLENTARVEAFTKDARTRIDAMMARLEVGQTARRIADQAPLIAAKAQRDQEKAKWEDFATRVNDPILREGYLRRAEGISNDDD